MIRLLFCLMLVLAAAACEEAPGETIHGVVQAPQPLILPLSGKKACVARLLYNRQADTSSGGGSVDFDEHRWAAGATLTLDGKQLALKGTKGKPGYTKYGEEWRWNTSAPSVPPKALWGWGFDSSFEALGSKSGHLGTRAVSVQEEYAACGDTISVRAIRSGTALQLVDTNKTEGANALRVAAGGFVGFFCCLALPILLLIVFVVRWSLKRRGPPE